MGRQLKGFHHSNNAPIYSAFLDIGSIIPSLHSHTVLVSDPRGTPPTFWTTPLGHLSYCLLGNTNIHSEAGVLLCDTHGCCLHTWWGGSCLLLEENLKKESELKQQQPRFDCFQQLVIVSTRLVQEIHKRRDLPDWFWIHLDN